MVIPYCRGGVGNQKPFKIMSYHARFHCFGMNVVQYDQISQIGDGVRTDFGPIGPNDTECLYVKKLDFSFYPWRVTI